MEAVMVKKTTTADTMASDSCPQKEIHAMRLCRGHVSVTPSLTHACLLAARDVRQAERALRTSEELCRRA